MRDRGLCPSFAPSHLGLLPKGRQRASSSKYVDIGAKCLDEYFIFQPTSFQNLNHERVFSWVRITLFIPAFSVPAFAVIYTHSKGFHMKRCSCQSFCINTHTRLYFTFYRTRMILIFQMSRKSIYSVLRKNTSSCGLLHNR